MMNTLHFFTGISTFLIQCCSIGSPIEFDIVFRCTGSDVDLYFPLIQVCVQYMMRTKPLWPFSTEGRLQNLQLWD